MAQGTSTSGTTPTESARTEPIVEEEEDTSSATPESTQSQATKSSKSKFQTFTLDDLPPTK